MAVLFEAAGGIAPVSLDACRRQHASPLGHGAGGAARCCNKEGIPRGVQVKDSIMYDKGLPKSVLKVNTSGPQIGYSKRSAAFMPRIRLHVLGNQGRDFFAIELGPSAE